MKNLQNIGISWKSAINSQKSEKKVSQTGPRVVNSCKETAYPGKGPKRAKGQNENFRVRVWESIIWDQISEVSPQKANLATLHVITCSV